MMMGLQRLVDAYFRHVTKFGEESAMKVLTRYNVGVCCDVPDDRIDEAINEMERGLE